MTRNIGSIDRALRIGGGILLLALGAWPPGVPALRGF